jgi:hypothetical protein
MFENYSKKNRFSKILKAVETHKRRKESKDMTNAKSIATYGTMD